MRALVWMRGLTRPRGARRRRVRRDIAVVGLQRQGSRRLGVRLLRQRWRPQVRLRGLWLLRTIATAAIA